MKFSAISKEKWELNPQIVELLIPAHRYLAELKGLARTLPNDKILLSHIRLKEAKSSSAIEGILTTQDSLYKHQIQNSDKNPANKEVFSYVKALNHGYKKVKAEGGISLNTLLEVQELIEPKRPGFRKIPGTVIKNMLTNEVVYTPPPPDKVPPLMAELDMFINSSSGDPLIKKALISPLTKTHATSYLGEGDFSIVEARDPLIKMALIHHQFESIHPFYDGNGRTGRVLNILFLVLAGVLDSPILYLSQYIHKHRADYYKHLQEARDQESWRAWIAYMLKGISVTAKSSISLIHKIDKLFKEHKNRIRSKHKFYSHELINNIFSYPYTTVDFLSKDLKSSKASSARYLDSLAEDGLLEKNKIGKQNYYINKKLFKLIHED